jgi:hypothetical protein
MTLFYLFAYYSFGSGLCTTLYGLASSFFTTFFTTDFNLYSFSVSRITLRRDFDIGERDGH